MERIEDIKENEGKTTYNFNVKNDAEFSLKSFFHTWTLANFSKCLNFSDATVYSPVFDFENATWRLVLHVNSNDHKLKEIKVRLYRTEKGETGHYLKYKFSICDDKSPLVTKEAESKFESRSDWGHRLTFKTDGDEKDALKFVLDNDILILHCEFLVLSANPCDQKSSGNPVPQNESTPPVKKPWMSYTRKKALPGNSKHLMNNMNHLIKNNNEAIFFAFMFCLLMPLFLIGLYTADLTQYHQDVNEINELIVDSTLKVLDIADAFNFTEVKMKSLDLLSSYHKSYNASKLVSKNYFDIISLKLKENISG